MVAPVAVDVGRGDGFDRRGWGRPPPGAGEPELTGFVLAGSGALGVGAARAARERAAQRTSSLR